MNQDLRARIKNLTKKLRGEHKLHLAQAIDDHWDKTVIEYSEDIFSYTTTKQIESALADAFIHEFKRIGYNDIDSMLKNLIQTRVLQTGPHLMFSQTPRMFCIDWLTTSSLTQNDYYFVAMFSGIPFTNNTRPGSIQFQNVEDLEKVIDLESTTGKNIQQSISNVRQDNPSLQTQRISLVPSKQQDQLVFGSKISKRAIEIYAALSDKMKQVIPQPNEDSSFTKWAAQSYNNVESKVLNHTNLVHFDIGEVLRSYLLTVLEDDSHSISKILFDTELHNRIISTFGEDTAFFYHKYSKGKYERQESLYIEGKRLAGKNTEIDLDRAVVLDGLRNRTLSPATFLTFTILSFVNHFKCLGSFIQVEYLSDYKNKWIALNLIEDVELVPTQNFTSGMFTGQTYLHPLDIYLGSAEITASTDMKFGELILPIWENDEYYGVKK